MTRIPTRHPVKFLRMVSGKALAAGSGRVGSRRANHPPLARCGSLSRIIGAIIFPDAYKMLKTNRSRIVVDNPLKIAGVRPCPCCVSYCLSS